MVKSSTRHIFLALPRSSRSATGNYIQTPNIIENCESVAKLEKKLLLSLPNYIYPKENFTFENWDFLSNVQNKYLKKTDATTTNSINKDKFIKRISWETVKLWFTHCDKISNHINIGRSISGREGTGARPGTAPSSGSIWTLKDLYKAKIQFFIKCLSTGTEKKSPFGSVFPRSNSVEHSWEWLESFKQSIPKNLQSDINCLSEAIPDIKNRSETDSKLIINIILKYLKKELDLSILYEVRDYDDVGGVSLGPRNVFDFVILDKKGDIKFIVEAKKSFTTNSQRAAALGQVTSQLLSIAAMQGSIQNIEFPIPMVLPAHGALSDGNTWTFVTLYEYGLSITYPPIPKERSDLIWKYLYLLSKTI